MRDPNILVEYSGNERCTVILGSKIYFKSTFIFINRLIPKNFHAHNF